MSSQIPSIRAFFDPAISWAKQVASNVPSSKEIRHALAYHATTLLIVAGFENAKVSVSLKKFLVAMSNPFRKSGAVDKQTGQTTVAHNQNTSFQVAHREGKPVVPFNENGNPVVPSNNHSPISDFRLAGDVLTPVQRSRDRNLEPQDSGFMEDVAAPEVQHLEKVGTTAQGKRETNSRNPREKEAATAADQAKENAAKYILSPLSNDLQSAALNNPDLAALLTGVEKGNRTAGILTASEFRQIQGRIEDAYRAALEESFAEAEFEVGDTHPDVARLADEHSRLQEDASTSIRKTCDELGWSQGSIQWEGGAPLLVRKGVSFDGLRSSGPDMIEGGFATVRRCMTDAGNDLVAKASKGKLTDKYGWPIDDLKMELDGYREVYEKVGPHKNLANVYGITTMDIRGTQQRVLLMDAVPGMVDGGTFFAQLQQCVKTGKISMEEYSAAVSYIAKSLLDVTEHLQRASIAHNDIKPENFVVDARTGEPVLVDMGAWSHAGKLVLQGTDEYMDPVLLKDKRGKGDTSTDIFTIGASMVDGMENMAGIYDDPDQGEVVPSAGLTHEPGNFRTDDDGNAVRIPGVVGAKTAYTDFVDQMMAQKKKRLTIQTAGNAPFIADMPHHPVRSPQERKASDGQAPGGENPSTPDAMARNVLRKVIDIGNRESNKPVLERWETKPVTTTQPVSGDALEGLKNEVQALSEDPAPTLAAYADLHRRTSGLTSQRALLVQSTDHGKIVEDLASRADALVDKHVWIDLLMEALPFSLPTTIKSDALEGPREFKNLDVKGLEGIDGTGALTKKQKAGLRKLKDGIAKREAKIEERAAGIKARKAEEVQKARQVAELISLYEIPASDFKNFIRDATAFLSDASTVKLVRDGNAPAHIQNQIDTLRNRLVSVKNLQDFIRPAVQKELPAKGFVQQRLGQLTNNQQNRPARWPANQSFPSTVSKSLYKNVPTPHVADAARKADQALRKMADEFFSTSPDKKAVKTKSIVVNATIEKMMEKKRPPGVLFPFELEAFETYLETTYKNSVNDSIKKTISHVKKDDPIRTSLRKEFEDLWNNGRDKVRALCREYGWTPTDAKKGNLDWKNGAPMFVKQGVSLDNVEIGDPLGRGGFAEIRKCVTREGHELAAKCLLGGMDESVSLEGEFRAYRKVYESVGPHKNLATVYGVAEFTVNGVKQKAMMMDAVPGNMTGQTFFVNMKKALDSGKISHEEYAAVTAFIGRRLFDVVEHLREAKITHNDIKPTNFLIDIKTGEPVVVDLGEWANAGEKAPGGTLQYMAPEIHPAGKGDGITSERGDVFNTAATLLHGVEGHPATDLSAFSQADRERLAKIQPRDGIQIEVDPLTDADGKVRRAPGIASVQTAYTRFMDKALAPREERIDATQAKNDPWLEDAPQVPIRSPQDRKNSPVTPDGKAYLRDADAIAQALVRKIASISAAEAGKPEDARWKTQHLDKAQNVDKAYVETILGEIDNLFGTPDARLHQYAQLYRKTEYTPELREMLEERFTALPGKAGPGEPSNELRERVLTQIRQMTKKMIDDAPWFDSLVNDLQDVLTAPVKSGVDRNGMKIATPETPDAERNDQAVGIKLMIEDLDSNGLEKLRKLAMAVPKFVRDAMTVKDVRDREMDADFMEKFDDLKVTGIMAQQLLDLIEPPVQSDTRQVSIVQEGIAKLTSTRPQ